MKRKRYMTNTQRFLALLMGVTSVFASCTNLIPDDLDALGDDVTVTTTSFSPYIGRTTVYENIVNVSNRSSLPLNFNIRGVRTVDGTAAPELLEKYPVKVWTQQYTGEETSLAEIEEKRTIEYRPILDMQQKNGDITFWNAGYSSFIKTAPEEGYLFDVEIANSGGRRYTRELVLQPRKERDYEPSQYDNITGLARQAFLRPTVTLNLYGERTGTPVSDTRVFVFEDTENTDVGNTLSISVLDSLGHTIDIQKFNNTDFEKLVHGFNHRFVDGKVVYDVAYPIPLIAYPTDYTNESGERARLALSYNRIRQGGFLQESVILFDFAIYREGHWEIQIRFNGETPNFENEQ